MNDIIAAALAREEARGRELALKLDDGKIIRDPTWRCVADVMKSFSFFGANRAYGILIYADTGEVHPHCAHLVDPDGSQPTNHPLG